MKLAKALWIFGNLLVNITIGIYIYLSSKAPLDPVERHNYINENWDIYASHWKAEFVFMTMIAIGAIYFAINFKKISWTLVSVGQLILLSLYPIMLGGYQNTPFEIAEMADQMAIVVFVFGNIVFLGGLLHLYLYDSLLNKWIRFSAVGFASIALIAFSISFMGFISWKQALIIGPLTILLFLINAYYGFKIKLENIKK
ncbi:hypothetical protein [Winogradskyella aurantia]|uniref:DUF998 domain-containing protein n=1 Tax=Winogradskyella aurantia TaxID=1915063 RepID=A0A265UXS6_9FLAO|nr:hypothetical protein [Winogradskyella aurantia]OZV70109.1 hypothetical protein CA834_05685 [Winogradskyella aurantia]